jgi:hypothetical protein
MRLLYGRWFSDRYRAVAEAVPAGCSVVDICAGDGYLYRRFLSQKSVVYTALDINPTFVRWLQRHEIQARQFDLRRDPIPEADVVLMMSALYQFIPEEKEILDKMLTAARRFVILAEPVRNLSASPNPVVAWLARRLTDPGTGESSGRLDQDRLKKLVELYTTDIFEPIAGGRDIIVRILR